MARSEAKTCTCPKAWTKGGPDAVNREGHAPECDLEVERLEGVEAAEHTHGQGEIPVHGKQK